MYPPNSTAAKVLDLLHDNSLSLADIGRRLEVSRERVRQIAAQHAHVTGRERQRVMRPLRQAEARKKVVLNRRRTTTRWLVFAVNRWLAPIGFKYCPMCRCAMPPPFHGGVCRVCNAEKMRTYRQTDHGRRQHKLWQTTNKDKMCLYKRRYLSKKAGKKQDSTASTAPTL